MEGELGSWETHMHRDALGPKHEGGRGRALGSLLRNVQEVGRG